MRSGVALRFSGLVALAVVASTATRPARAQNAVPSQGPTAAEQLLAQSLFEQARALMDAGKFAEACPKLAESQRLDPGGGTLLNLAVCHEKEGRVGTAYLELTAAATQARRDGRKDRESLANEHLAAISPRLPRLAVRVLREEEDLEVTVDGTVVRRPAWGVPTVVDPGRHVIEARATGKTPFAVEIAIGEAEKRTVEIPPLATPVGNVMGTSLAPYEHPAAREKRSNAPRILAGVVAGVGVSVAAVSGYVWLFATIERNSQCNEERSYCSQKGLEAADRERLTFWVAMGGLAAGALGVIGVAALPSIRVSATPTNGGAAGFLSTTF